MHHASPTSVCFPSHHFPHRSFLSSMYPTSIWFLGVLVFCQLVVLVIVIFHLSLIKGSVSSSSQFNGQGLNSTQDQSPTCCFCPTSTTPDAYAHFV